MKRCPQCGREYDLSMSFCLDDGSELLYGPASGGHLSEPPASAGGELDEPQTAIMHETAPPDEAPTRAQIHTTDRTAVLRQGAEAEQTKRKWLAVAAAAVVLIIGGISFAIYKFWPGSDDPPQAMSIERLTTNGKTRDAAISPDGKYVVYVVDEGGQQSLWTRQIATTSNVQIIPPGEGRYAGLVFTPDSNYINFVKRERPDAPLTVFQMPLLGGAQRKLIAVASGGVGYSPDGKQIAFVRHAFPEVGESSLLIANADGTEERIVSTLRTPDMFGSAGQVPAWSPDGRSIASIVLNLMGAGSRVVEVQVADGSVSDLGVQGWHFLRRIAWLPDKSGFLVLGTEKSSGRYNQQISRISYPDGKVSRVTTDSQNYTGMSVSADFGALVAIQFSVISNIWTAPNGDAARAAQIRSGGHNLDGVSSLVWAPDGRIVYSSLASGTEDLWIMNGDGSGHKQLTAESGSNFDAAVAPDGRYIVYTSEREGGHNIWRMDMDGGNPIQLTRGNNDENAAVSVDSQWVLYDSRSSGEWNVWKVSIDGGDPVRLTDYSSNGARISPDGKLIACNYRENVHSPWRKAIFPFEGGKPIRVFDMERADRFQWASDSGSLHYNDTVGGVGNIFSFPLEGGAPKELTKFKSEEIYNFGWSADYKTLALARGTTTMDAVLIRNFR